MTQECSQHEAVATSLVACVPIGFAAAYFHLKQGNVAVRTAGLISVCSAGAMLAASSYTRYVPDETMRQMFGGYLVVIAGLMLRK
jgi:uncharacterized membrane protein YfcA